VKRSLLLPLLSAFDFPDVDSSCEARFVTTQPQQSLTMLNGSFFNEQSRRLAELIAETSSSEPRDRVKRAIELVLLREATAEEISEGLRLVDRLQKAHGQTPNEALRYWCLTVLNLNEFVYLD
jgi:hypothetical protein